MAPKRARSPTGEADRAAARAAKARERADHAAAVERRKVEQVAKREEAARAKAVRDAERKKIKEKRDDGRSRLIVEQRLEELVMEVARGIVRRERERLSV